MACEEQKQLVDNKFIPSVGKRRPNYSCFIRSKMMSDVFAFYIQNQDRNSLQVLYTTN